MTRRINAFACLALLSLGLAGTLSAQTVPPADKDQEAKLIAVLKSDAPLKDKADACRELSLIGTKESIAPLAALLGDEKLSHLARYGLEPIPDPAVDEALRNALGKLKGRPLIGVIGSLGVRRDTKAVGPLVRIAQGRRCRCRAGRGAGAGPDRRTQPAAEALEGALDVGFGRQSTRRLGRLVPMRRSPGGARKDYRSTGDLRQAESPRCASSGSRKRRAKSPLPASRAGPVL